MKILIIATTMGLGGAEKQISDLVNNFESKGHKVTIIILKGDFYFTVPQSVDIIKINSKKNIFGFIKSIFTIVKTIKKIRPDVVHSHMATANLISRAAKIFTHDTPLISTAHSLNEGGGGTRIFLYRVTDFLSNLTTNVSTEAVENYIQRKAAPRHKIKAVYNGVDLSEFTKKSIEAHNINGLSPCKNKGPIILNVARLVEAKDHDNLLRAFCLFKEKYNDAILVIAGDGHLKHEISDLAIKLKISNSVLMLGARKDISDLMSVADLFVLSSAWEGFGLVLAEAMACELPVVTTDCGGTKEVVSSYGLTVTVKNPAELCVAMEKTIELDKEALAEQTKLAKSSVQQRFEIGSISNIWLQLYKEQTLRTRKEHSKNSISSEK